MIRLRNFLSAMDHHCSLAVLKQHALTASHAARFVLSVATVLGLLTISVNSTAIEEWWDQNGKEDCTYGQWQWRCASLLKGMLESAEYWDAH